MVSIILCTYNRGPLLPRVIESVLQQTFADWELIIIDDGSSDNTKKIIEPYFEQHQRIRYFFQENKGLALARNAGLAVARGEFITFVDSDDEYDPKHIELRIKFLLANQDVDMIHGGVKLIGPKEKYYVVDLSNPKKKIHLKNCHIGGTFFFRKEIVERIEGFREIPFGEDFDFYTRAKEYFVIHKVKYSTYLYHLEANDRLCDIFTNQLHRK